MPFIFILILAERVILALKNYDSPTESSPARQLKIMAGKVICKQTVSCSEGLNLSIEYYKINYSALFKLFYSNRAKLNMNNLKKPSHDS